MSIQVIGLDRDEESLDIARERLKRFKGSYELKKANFKDLENVLNKSDLGEIGGVVYDLGLSSFQLEKDGRGFSIKLDGPLDMRMGPGAALTAEALVNDWPEDEIARVLRDYGEERHWRLLARRICDVRAARPIRTTRELVAAIGRVPGVNKRGRSGNVHPATRAFQGIRIAVNDELGAAEAAIPAAIDCLAPGGRLAIITFHSLEDRIVKNAFRKFAGRVEAPDRPISAWEMPPEPSRFTVKSPPTSWTVMPPELSFLTTTS